MWHLDCFQDKLKEGTFAKRAASFSTKKLVRAASERLNIGATHESEQISCDESPVGMDAVYVHALILDRLTTLENRLKEIEAVLAAN